MLNLKEIKKDYQTSSETVHALKGVSIAFRRSEFVSILGPSGCGKTTLLNIIGGLDKYTDGDLIINGRSTKSYSDRDWDVYRNHRIGFIFQSYNLIPHQTVLTNVELALTIAGVSKEERVARAKQALDRVGLSGQYHKRPNQLSGGQCQRVAIARALVNDPEILLADEPTGALDTVTSVQIMDLIREISNERLVIMVTHNPDLAEQYSSRIVRLIDGEITEDSNPFSEEEEAAECLAIEEELMARELAEAEAEKALNESAEANSSDAFVQEKKKQPKKRKEKAKMSFFTAFMLSLKNLFTKKGRTTLTAFAGSIGIIGIALILAVSEGMTAYIDHVQETALSSYPITIENETTDISALMETLFSEDDGTKHSMNEVHKNPMISELVAALQKVTTNKNDLKAFKEFLDTQLKDEDSELYSAVTGIQYSYDLNIPIYTENVDGKIVKSDTAELMTKMLAKYMIGMATGGTNLGGSNLNSVDTGSMSSNMMSTMMGLVMWQELLADKPDSNGSGNLVNPLLKEQYDLVSGSWPKAYDEIVLVLDENNELDDLTLYALGLISEDEINAIIEAAVNKTDLPPSDKTSWSYDEIRALTFKTILPGSLYVPNGDGTFRLKDSKEPDYDFWLKSLCADALELKVSGIIRPNPDAETTMLSGAIGYTQDLTKYVIAETLKSDVVIAQLATPGIDVLTGRPFKEAAGKLSDTEKKTAFKNYVSHLSDEEKLELFVSIQCIKSEMALVPNTDVTTLDFAVTQAKNNIKELLANKTNEEKIATLMGFLAGGNSSVDSESVDVSVLEDALAKLSDDQIIALLEPYIIESCRMEIAKGVEEGFKSVPDATKLLMLEGDLSDTTTEAQFAIYYDRLTEFSESNYDDNLIKIGCLDVNSPHSINIFASSFENKDIIAEVINDYNKGVDEEKRISYTDLIGILMSSITIIIDAITYVLIAFVAISLVVSSIMIGVITLISVQERTKEIGILRAIGASKRNVSAMFNAETIIIGLAAGLLGIGVSYLLCIPINLILNALTGIPNLKAILPIGAAAILVLISMLLTLISGLIPSRSAAKKDPVVALRTE
ncbi:MAG: ABC transporter ATP-binding protein/permease [Ruminococcaceae bacterium]|nr:ABC transporter ATP-binding protein/permease [Oscillospiraceae bacterium]